MVPMLTGDGVVGGDADGGCVGDSRHSGLLALLLLPVHNKEEEKEQHQQHQDDDARNDADLVGVHRHCSASQAVGVSHDHHPGYGRRIKLGLGHIQFN